MSVYNNQHSEYDEIENSIHSHQYIFEIKIISIDPLDRNNERLTNEKLVQRKNFMKQQPQQNIGNTGGNQGNQGITKLSQYDNHPNYSSNIANPNYINQRGIQYKIIIEHLDAYSNPYSGSNSNQYMNQPNPHYINQNYSNYQSHQTNQNYNQNREAGVELPQHQYYFL